MNDSNWETFVIAILPERQRGEKQSCSELQDQKNAYDSGEKKIK